MVTSAFMPAMKHTSRGRKHTERPVVAMINSHASRMALPNMAAYSASKAALASFADAIRPELASNGIHVVQIHPGGLQILSQRVHSPQHSALQSQFQHCMMLLTPYVLEKNRVLCYSKLWWWVRKLVSYALIDAGTQISTNSCAVQISCKSCCFEYRS